MSPVEVLCGVDAHAKLERENAELRAVLRDVLEGKGLTFTKDELEGLDRVRRIIEADGCFDCAFRDEPGGRHQHFHHPADRASAYRLLLGPDSIGGLPRKDNDNTVRAALLRTLNLLIKAGA